jgi:hypothetical protein
VIGGAILGAMVGGALGLAVFLGTVPETDPLFAIGHVTAGTTCGAAVGGLVAYWLARPSGSTAPGNGKSH